MPVGGRAAYLPTVAYANQDGSLVLGEAAEQRAAVEPDRVARQFTSRVGDGTPLNLGGISMTADVLTARFVAHVLGSVATLVGGPAARVALTHPVGWGQHRLASLRFALTAHGLGATVFLSAAQAAAHAYAERVPVATGELVAVHDLGGSGFDAAVVRRTADGQFAVAGRPEELAVGGLDFDELVFDHVRSVLAQSWDSLDPTDPAVLAGVARLRRDCAAAKEALSADTDVRIPVALPGIETEVRLARAEFEELIRPVVEETAATLQRAIGGAGSSPDEVSAVLLTGGSARIPLVTQVISEHLGRAVTVAADPKGDTAIGAALAIGALEAPAQVAAPAPGPAQVAAEPTRIGLRAAPLEASSLPSRPPIPVIAPAPAKPARGVLGLPRTVVASVAAGVLALAVGGGILLAAKQGPADADAEPEPAGTTSSTEQTVTTTTKPPSSTKKTAPPQEPVEETVPPQGNEEPEQPTEEQESTTAEPTESTPPVEETEPSEPTPPSETEPTTPEDPDDPPADPPAEENQQPGGDQ
ncbi:MAG TPA: Hsp70 family protein [Actinophytocola sp.]|nr:Hsp70 family protein [Actinophytocola sp.]